MTHHTMLDKRQVPAGTTVIRQGTAGNNAYVIESGRVEVFIEDAAGQVTVVAALGPEAMFGEMAAVTGGLRSASVRAVEDTVLINIPIEDLQEYIRLSAGLSARLMRMVTDRMWNNNLNLQGKTPDTAADDSAVTLRDLALHVAPATSETSGAGIFKSLWKLFTGAAP